VTYRATDGDLVSNEATLVIHVTAVNDAPVAVDDENTTDEDTAVATDVIANDTDVDNGNGQLKVKPGSLGATNGTATLDADGRTIHFTPGADKNDGNVGPAGFTVTYRATDGDLVSNEATLVIHVTAVNDKPTIATDDATVTVDEGQTAHNTGTWADIDEGDTVTLTASVGVVTENPGGTWSWSYATTDGPDNSQTVTITAKDAAGATSDTTFALTVRNVAPIVALTGPNAANVGDTKPYSFTITDPAGAADAQTYAAGFPTCGANGTVITSSITYSGGNFTCKFTSAGDSTVAVKVNDGNADSNTSSVIVAVNAPPGVDAGPNVSGAEGSAISLDGTVSDPEGNSFTVKWTYTAGAGVDAGTTCAFANDAAVDTTINCTDDGTFTVKLEATDSKGATSSDTATVTVSNAKPVVTAQNETPAPFAQGTTVSLVANFSDAGRNDTHKAPAGGSCTISWDDGSPSSTGTVTEPVGTTPGTCTASHTYAGPGVYTVTFTVTDDDGGSGTATVLVVVYDPSAGFVTGGGFINVGTGSYTANPALTGRANFGFTSQYKKNANIPTGETEFQFQVGNLNFHSTAYTWLVVSGYKAQYKGTGTVNGSGTYDFTLTVYDGQISGGGGDDRFRIRITAGNNGNAVVFDNRNGAPTDMDLATPQTIAGGSIVIHK
jgi:hypothetical protein